MDYDSLLNRGKADMPDKVEQKNRFEVPPVKLQAAGKKTIVTNFGEICDRLIRDPDVVAKYLLKELGTAGSRSGGRIVLNGVFTTEAIDSVIRKFVDAFVMCRVCHLPDTKIVKDKKDSFIVCEACGARYVIKMIS